MYESTFSTKKMVRSLQYRVAFLISSLCVCVALLLETWKNRGVDRFAALSASEAVCGVRPAAHVSNGLKSRIRPVVGRI